MKPNIHPAYKEITVVCSCGSSFVTRSTLDKEQLTLEVCAMCHPFYTGTQKIVDTAGRVDRFRQKYGMKKAAAEKADEPAPKKPIAEKIEAQPAPAKKAAEKPESSAPAKKAKAEKAETDAEGGKGKSSAGKTSKAKASKSAKSK